MNTQVNVGVIGCGKISDAYFSGCRSFPILNIRACADLDLERARQKAAQHDIPLALTVEDLLADPEIDLVINLTVPQAHAQVNLLVIAAGKHVYTEKPLAVTRADALQTLEAAHARGVLVGCAPDTVLGGGIQTCRGLIDQGAIGVPVAATAFMVSHGPESWHPNPGFYYQIGGGPMLDMGPYYLSALITLLGPIRRVTGSAQMSFPERIATSPARNGERLPVEVATHVAGVIDFASGAVGTIITSFDVWYSHLPRIEIYGSEGSLSVPDPNTFRGPVKLRRAGEADWREIELTHSDAIGRGTGVADMAYAIRSGRQHRASGALAYHVLDAMYAFEDASQTGRHIELTSQVERPAALPAGLPLGQLDS